MLAMDHTPTIAIGQMKCWDFNSKATCAMGANCPNSHEHFHEGGLHLASACELMRRGGRNLGKLAGAGEIEGRVQQLRDQNRREHGGKIVDGKHRTERHGIVPEVTAVVGSAADRFARV